MPLNGQHPLKNKQHKDTCLKHIGQLHSQNVLTILGSIINIIGLGGGGEKEGDLCKWILDES